MNDLEPKSLRDICPGARESAAYLAISQGSTAWYDARIGILTASNAGRCVTSQRQPAKGQTRQGYINGLLAERLTGLVEMNHVNLAMERGTQLEPQARAWYEVTTGREVRRVGFVYADAAHRYGGSPDGLLPDAGIEIKCPMRRAMISTLLRGTVPPGYIPQIQFLMWVTGLPRWDFVLYTPEGEIPNAIWPVEADEAMHAAYDEHVPAFLAELDAAEAKLREMQT
jgi:hypothetical protein